MTAQSAARPCHAQPAGTLMICDRCGLEWPLGGARSPCDRVTYSALRAYLQSAIASDEAWMRPLSDARDRGEPCDPRPQRRRIALLATLLRMVEAAMAGPSIPARTMANRPADAGTHQEPADAGEHQEHDT